MLSVGNFFMTVQDLSACAFEITNRIFVPSVLVCVSDAEPFWIYSKSNATHHSVEEDEILFRDHYSDGRQ